MLNYYGMRQTMNLVKEPDYEIGEWVFEYDSSKTMTNTDLEIYQNKLVELRRHHKNINETLIHNKPYGNTLLCEFYSENNKTPPEHNIFARFNYICLKHNPPHHGWYLLWNPNLDTNREKARSLTNNFCAPFDFQSICKKIQNDFVKQFPNYFSLIDNYDFDFPLNYHQRTVAFSSTRRRI
jgi:hypothetical protein